MSNNVRTIPLRVSGYHISITGDGDVGSASAASVVFRTYFDETWDGMAITAKFTDAAGETVTDVLLASPATTQNTDGSWNVVMPHEATKYEGNALLTFDGVKLDITAWIASAKKTEGTGITGVAVLTGGVDTFAGKVEEVGVYEFSRVSGAWKLGDTSVTLSEYGLSVTGTEADGDKFVVDLRHPIERKQTTKPLEFHVYASETERTGDNTEPIQASDREQLLAAIDEAHEWANGGDTGGTPSETNNAKYYSETAEDWAVGTRGGQTGTHTTDNAAKSASDAADAADDAADKAELSREYAEGKDRDGNDVQSGDPGYHNNSRYWNNQSHLWATGNMDSETPSALNNAKKYKELAETAKQGAETARDTAALWATGGTSGTPSASNNAKKYAENAGDAAQAAFEYAEAADGSAQTAEAWAVGTKDGQEDPSHVNNNSQYWSVIAEERAYDAEDWAVGTRDGETGEHADECAKHYADEAATAAETAVEAALDEVLPIAAENLATDAVETAKIKDLNVTTGKLADGAVTNDKLGSKAVKTANIDDGAVGTEQLSDGAVSTEKVENRAITAPKIGIGEVKTPNLDTGAVVTSKIYDGAVTTAKLAADAKELIYSMLPTESAQGEAIKTDLGAALPMANLDLVATAGSGAVTVRQNGVNLIDLGSAPNQITVLGTSRAGYALALPAGYYLFRLALTGVGSTYLNLAVISSAGTDVTCETDNRRLLYNSGTVPTVTRSEGGVLYTNGEAGIPAGREIVRVKIQDGDRLCIFSRDSYSTGVSQWNYVAGAQVELSAEVTNPFDSVAHQITAYAAINTTIEVSGAGTYPVTPTPTTALGVNTLWIVPGSGVTATLDAVLRLDPTLTYNSLKEENERLAAAIVAAGAT